MDGEDAAQSLADNAPFVLSHPPQPQLSPHTSQDTHTKLILHSTVNLKMFFMFGDAQNVVITLTSTKLQTHILTPTTNKELSTLV